MRCSRSVRRWRQSGNATAYHCQRGASRPSNAATIIRRARRASDDFGRWLRTVHQWASRGRRRACVSVPCPEGLPCPGRWLTPSCSLDSIAQARHVVADRLHDVSDRALHSTRRDRRSKPIRALPGPARGSTALRLVPYATRHRGRHICGAEDDAVVARSRPSSPFVVPNRARNSPTSRCPRHGHAVHGEQQTQGIPACCCNPPSDRSRGFAGVVDPPTPGRAHRTRGVPAPMTAFDACRLKRTGRRSRRPVRDGQSVTLMRAARATRLVSTTRRPQMNPKCTTGPTFRNIAAEAYEPYRPLRSRRQNDGAGGRRLQCASGTCMDRPSAFDRSWRRSHHASSSHAAGSRAHQRRIDFLPSGHHEDHRDSISTEPSRV